MLPPGIHKFNLAQFAQQFVSSFPADAARARLFLLMSQWIADVQAVPINAILWVNGSFVTQKPAPGDIDCVLWIPSPPPRLSMDQELVLTPLLDHDAVKVKYGLDLYMEPPLPEKRVHREAYWRGMFGFQHDGVSAKGFVEIAI